MLNKVYLLGFIVAISLNTVQAFADGPRRVKWQPASGGSCENCELIGHQMPFWNLQKAKYKGANLSYSSLHGSLADQADFTDIIAKHADFSGSSLNNTSFTNAVLKHSRFNNMMANGSNFAGADLSYCNLSKASLIGATLDGLIAPHLKAPGAVFSAATVTGAILDEANLRGAIFEGADLSEASFAKADIAGASFQDSYLKGTNLATAINYQSANFAGACRNEATQLPSDLSLEACKDAATRTEYALNK